MSKAPKPKKAQLHYQPYQSATAVSNGELQHNAMEFSVPDMPLHMDPVLSGLSSNLSRNLWDDWNENDGTFAMKFDMFPDDSNSGTSASGSARSAPALAPQLTPPTSMQQQQQNHHQQHQQQQQLQQQQLQQQLQHQLQHQMSMSMLASINASSSSNSSSSAGVIPSSAYDVMTNGSYSTIRPTSASDHSSSSSAMDASDEPRANYRRSLSEDLVSMLDENNELVFGGAKQQQQQLQGVDNSRRQLSPPNGLVFSSTGSSASATATTTSSSSSNSSANTSNGLSPAQQMQMQQQLQQQLQRQQQLQQLAMANENARWFANAQHALLQQHRPDLFARRHSAFETAVAAASTTLTAMPAALQPDDTPSNASERSLGAATPTTGSSSSSAAPFGAFAFASGASSSETSESSAAPADPKTAVAQSPSSASSSGAESMATDTSTVSGASATSSSASAPASSPFGAQNGMVMPGFMMYPMPMMGNYQPNAMGMLPLQMPLGMNMGAAMGMQMGAMGPMGMQLPLGMQMQMPLGMQLPMHGMQMPMNSMGLPMGMQMPLGMQVPTPQPTASAIDTSARATDMDVTPIALTAAAAAATTTASAPSASATAVNGAAPIAAAPVLKPAPAARALQPKDPRGASFVSIARKPDEPEVSSILKSLMDEEARKKEKKLERNRDSARESRKKQQSYVEALETGIKRLQINRDLVSAYRWGVTGPGFGPLPCPQSPQMYDWKTRIAIVTGDSESFSNIQNPAGFHSLMRMNRQRRALSLSHDERERAVTKSFVAIGKRLAALRARVLEAQVLRTFSDSPVAAELSAALNLSADQKLQLQCHAQRVLDEEVVHLVKLFKVFFALRTEALRLHILSPSLERFFRDVCSLEQLQKLLQWTETHRSVVEHALVFDA